MYVLEYFPLPQHLSSVAEGYAGWCTAGRLDIHGSSASYHLRNLTLPRYNVHP